MFRKANLIQVLCLALLVVACQPVKTFPEDETALMVTEPESLVPQPTQSQELPKLSPSLPTMTPTPLSLSATPSATPTPVLPTVAPPPTWTPTVSHASLDFRLAYLIWDYTDIKVASSLWLLDPPYDEPRLLFAPPSGVEIISSAAIWSPDGRQLAFIQMESVRTLAVWIIDVDSGNTRQVTISFPIEIYEGGRATSAQIISWSLDGQWIYWWIHDARPPDEYYRYIVNVETGTLFELGDLQWSDGLRAWSPTEAGRYAYEYHNQAYEAFLNIGQVGEDEPVASFPSHEQWIGLIDVAWHPGGDFLVAIDAGDPFKGRRKHGLWSLDLGEGIWRPIDNLGKNFEPWHIEWSPTGEWLAVDDLYQIAFIPASALDELPTFTQRHAAADPLAWLGEGDILLFQVEDKLFTIHPSVPKDVIQVLSLGHLGLDNTAIGPINSVSRGPIKAWAP